jgi:ABC-type transporter Mla MlaB component
VAQTHALDAGSRPTAGRAEPPYSLSGAPGQLVFAGELRLGDGPSLWKALRARIRDAAPPRLDFEVSRLRYVDGAAAAMIAAARRDLEARGITCELVGADTSVARILALYEPVSPPEPARVPGFVERFGREVADAFRGLAGAVSFVGEMAAETAAAVVRPRTANWR